MAEDLGDQDKAKQIQDQLNELEERAEALDRQRTKNISAIRCVTEPLLIGFLSLVHILATVIRWACGLVHAVLHWLLVSLRPELSDSLPYFTVHWLIPLLYPLVTSTSGTGNGILWSLRRPWWWVRSLSGSLNIISVSKMIWNTLYIWLEFIF